MQRTEPFRERRGEVREEHMPGEAEVAHDQHGVRFGVGPVHASLAKRHLIYLYYLLCVCLLSHVSLYCSTARFFTHMPKKLGSAEARSQGPTLANRRSFTSGCVYHSKMPTTFLTYPTNP